MIAAAADHSNTNNSKDENVPTHQAKIKDLLSARDPHLDVNISICCQ
jgi:hypothetical protein